MYWSVPVRDFHVVPKRGVGWLSSTIMCWGGTEAVPRLAGLPPLGLSRFNRLR